MHSVRKIDLADSEKVVEVLQHIELFKNQPTAGECSRLTCVVKTSCIAKQQHQETAHFSSKGQTIQRILKGFGIMVNIPADNTQNTASSLVQKSRARNIEAPPKKTI